jgi:tetratricopeptide (TPR) repeat protein
MSGVLAPGESFAGYRIKGLVGRGGMGIVYQAFDPGLERLVALKLLAPELAQDPRFRERFLRETKLAASLEHPHVLPVHGAGEHEGSLYLVTRFVEGEDLRGRLGREGPLEPEEALRIVEQLASALDVAHAKGLVHRDVKPGNVLLDGTGEAYLADFGLAKPVAGDGGPTMTGGVVGTLAYLAPEQIRAEDVDGRADQYALACLAFECLAGRAPFERESEAQLLFAHLHEPPPPIGRRESPTALDAALARALAKEPKERYATCTELAEAARRTFARGAATAAAWPPPSAFVGRERELVALLDGLDDAIRGHGRLYLVSGEPGIGKSRLAEELAVRARAAGAHVLVGRCWEAAGAPAYWPWVQALRGHVRESEPAALRSQLDAGAAELAQILPELRELLPGLPDPAPGESEGARFQLFDAAAAFLRSASQTRPLLLVLDDLHAADVPSLLLLQFVARELGSTHVLLLGAFRDVDPAPPPALTELLAELAREPVYRRLALSGLGEPDVAQYIELTAADIASSELVAALCRETEGNPLFVGETVRLLSLEGVRSDSTGELRLAIPQSVRDVIARRLAHLSERCNRVLVLAAVIGREFALDALARLSSVSEDEVLEVLDEAMVARVVSDVPAVPGRLRFAHVLIRDTLYEGLTTARRVQLHRLAVEALEGLYGDDPGSHVAELAHHAIAGAEFQKGLRYAWSGGDRALELLAYEEAARLYEMALDALDLVRLRDEKARCELLLSLGEAEARAGNSPAAKRAFLAAAEISRGGGLPRELARAAAGYGGRFMWARSSDDPRLVPLLEEALAALASEDVELRARLLARLAGALRDEHSRDRRDRLSREAVEVARQSGNLTALAFALDGRAAAIVAPDTVNECLALGTELGEVAARIGDKERVLNAADHRRIAQVMLGDLNDAKSDLMLQSAIADHLRQPAQQWQVYGSRAMFALASGELTAAEGLIEQAFAFGERALRDTATPVYRLQRYTLCDFLGRYEEAEPTLRELVDAYPARIVFRCALAHLHTRLGRTTEAKAVLDELARDGFSALPFDQEWLFGMSFLAETSAYLRDERSARVLYPLLLPWRAFNAADVAEGIRGSVHRYLGLLAKTIGRFDGAIRHFDAALEMNERMGAWPWVAHTEEDAACALLERDLPGDRQRARDLLARCLTTCRELGLTALEAKAATLVASCPSRGAG